MSDAGLGFIGLIVTFMVGLGLLVLLLRIVTSRLFLNLSVFLALLAIGGLVLLIALGA
jgi:hypothetical protein